MRVLVLLPLIATACAPSIRIQGSAECRTRVAVYRGNEHQQSGEERNERVPMRVNSVDSGHIEIQLADGCRVRARMTRNDGRPWAPRRHYSLEPGQTCRWNVPDEGVQPVSVFGQQQPRDPAILDGPPEREGSTVFVDSNNDTDLTLYGQVPSGAEVQLRCQYLVSR
jgi:hypothetical protein